MDKVLETAETLMDLQARDLLPGWRVETFGDQIVMLAGTRWEHDNIIDIVKEQVPRPRNCKITNVPISSSTRAKSSAFSTRSRRRGKAPGQR